MMAVDRLQPLSGWTVMVARLWRWFSRWTAMGLKQLMVLDVWSLKGKSGRVVFPGIENYGSTHGDMCDVSGGEVEVVFKGGGG